MLASDSACTLPDGRRLGYSLLGDSKDFPLFFFHGTPGSRLDYAAEDPIAKIPGYCLIQPERPGYGLSDPKPDRKLGDWPEDVAALADHLGYKRFAVGGISGGGPHALACAYRLHDRLTATIVLASPAPSSSMKGMSPGNRIGAFLGRLFTPLLRFAMEKQRQGFEKDPEKFLDAIGVQTAACDRELLKDPLLRRAIIRSLREAYRQGGEAQFVDGRLGLSQPVWDFPIQDIRGPVHLWYGAEDRLVSRAMAEKLAREIPESKVRIIPGAGHLLTENEQVMKEIADVLVEALPR